MAIAVTQLSAAADPATSAGGTDAQTASTFSEINAAIAAEPLAMPAAKATAPTGPLLGSDPVKLGGGVSLALPATGARETAGGTSIYAVPGTSDAQVVLQDVGIGTRALVNVDSAAAPQRYEFTLQETSRS